MSVLNNPLAIHKLLPGTNCKKCRYQTCMAFAAAVFKGDKRLGDCPYVESDDASQEEQPAARTSAAEEEEQRKLEELRQGIGELDLQTVAPMIGAEFDGERVSIVCLGKKFEVDAHGNISSQCHVNRWLTIPILDYMLTGKGADPRGEWLPLRELREGATLNPLFQQMCEKPLKKLADSHTDLFEDIMWIFSGKRATDAFDSDIALVLHPLPKVPIMICYWQPEDGMESSVNLFFDKTAEENLDIGSLYLLGVGIVTMFHKIMHSHRTR